MREFFNTRGYKNVFADLIIRNERKEGDEGIYERRNNREASKNVRDGERGSRLSRDGLTRIHHYVL